jgi:hypothetical protein
MYSEFDDNKINFRQFVRVLAHFRPTSKSNPNGINSRVNKLRCKPLLVNILNPFSCVLDVRLEQEQLYHTRGIQVHFEYDGWL